MNAGPRSQRPFSPFLRLLFGAGLTLLLAEFARFQADLAWAALPAGAGLVVTLASVGRGMRARRAWRTQVAAHAAEAAGTMPDELPVPQGAGPSPLEAEPHDVDVHRRDPAPAWPDAPLIDEHDLVEPVLARAPDGDPAPDDGGSLRSDPRARAPAPVERD